MSRDPLEEQEGTADTNPIKHATYSLVPQEPYHRSTVLGAPYNLDEYEPDPLYGLSQGRQGISKHKLTSFIKSGIRITASIAGASAARLYTVHAFPHVLYGVAIAFALFGVAELVGIFEEQFENE